MANQHMKILTILWIIMQLTSAFSFPQTEKPLGSALFIHICMGFCVQLTNAQ